MNKLKDWKEVIFEDFPDMNITENTIRTSARMAQRGYRTNMRISTERVYTSKDYESWRADILNTPLP